MSESILIRVKGEVPERGSLGAAAYDLRAADDYFVEGQHHTLVKTTTSVEIPYGCVGLVCSRSGLANNKGIHVLNSPGVIDSDFRSEIGVILMNTTLTDFRGQKGDRIAQLLIVPAYHASFMQAEELTETERGAGSFGSTGIK